MCPTYMHRRSQSNSRRRWKKPRMFIYLEENNSLGTES
nr:MAG TPA: hypothetical protein [Caudoviricetes sp.]